MHSTKVAIFGGTGQTGAAVAMSLERRGAAALRLSRSDVAEGASCLDGADVGYVIAPNMHPLEPELVSGYLELMREAGVPRVVYHSVASPYAPAMTHHVGKAVSEDLVRTSGLAWTVLQPSAYIQNFLPTGEPSVIRVPFSLDVRFGMVDLADVGEAAAVVSLDDAHTGATFELGGLRQITIREAAQIATDFLDRAVEAVAESSHAWAERAGQAFAPEVTSMFVSMWDYYDRHGLPTGGLPLAALLGRPATSYAEVLARVTQSDGAMR